MPPFDIVLKTLQKQESAFPGLVTLLRNLVEPSGSHWNFSNTFDECIAFHDKGYSYEALRACCLFVAAFVSQKTNKTVLFFGSDRESLCRNVEFFLNKIGCEVKRDRDGFYCELTNSRIYICTYRMSENKLRGIGGDLIITTDADNMHENFWCSLICPLLLEIKTKILLVGQDLNLLSKLSQMTEDTGEKLFKVTKVKSLKRRFDTN